MLAGLAGQFVAAFVVDAARHGVVLEGLEVRTTAAHTCHGAGLSFTVDVVSEADAEDIRVMGQDAACAAMSLFDAHRSTPSLEIIAQKPARAQRPM